MKKDDWIMWLAIAGGAFAVYWYVTRNGPGGAVYDANGNAIPGALSYWDSWFGTAVATAQPVTGTTATGTATAPASTLVTAPVTVPVSTPTSTSTPALAPVPTLIGSAGTIGAPTGPATPLPASTAAMLDPTSNALVNASGGNPSIQLTASQWNWYWTHTFGDPGPFNLGDNGQPMSVQTYMQMRAAAGFPVAGGAMIVNTPGTPLRPVGVRTGNDPLVPFSGGVGGGVSGIVPLPGGMTFGGSGGAFKRKEWKN